MGLQPCSIIRKRATFMQLAFPAVAASNAHGATLNISLIFQGMKELEECRKIAKSVNGTAVPTAASQKAHGHTWMQQPKLPTLQTYRCRPAIGVCSCFGTFVIAEVRQVSNDPLKISMPCIFDPQATLLCDHWSLDSYEKVRPVW